MPQTSSPWGYNDRNSMPQKSRCVSLPIWRVRINLYKNQINQINTTKSQLVLADAKNMDVGLQPGFLDYFKLRPADASSLVWLDRKQRTHPS